MQKILSQQSKVSSNPLDKLLYSTSSPIDKLLIPKHNIVKTLLSIRNGNILNRLLKRDSKTDIKLKDDQINSIIERNIRENRSFVRLVKELESSGDATALQRAYGSLVTNFKKYLFYGIVGGLTITVLISSASFFGAGAGVYAILKLLLAAGATKLPSVLYPLVSKLAKSVGSTLAPDVSVNAVLGLAKKNVKFAKLLETEIKFDYLEKLVKSLGIVSENEIITRELVFKKIVQLTTRSGSTLLISGPSGLVSLLGYDVAMTGLSVSKVVAKKIYENITRSSSDVVNKIVNGLGVENTIAETMKNQPKIIPIKLEKIKPVIPTSDVTSLRTETVTALTAGSIAAVLVGYALTPEKVISDSFQGVVDVATKLSEYHSVRSGIAAFLIDKVGMSRLADVVSKTQYSLIRDLLKTPDKPGFVNEFFSLLVGDKLYSREELSTYNIQKLLEIAKSKRVKLKNTAKQNIIKAISEDQNVRIEKITGLISDFLVTTVSSAVTYEIADKLATINYTKELDFIKSKLYSNLEKEIIHPGETGFVLKEGSEVSAPNKKELKEAHKTLGLREKTAAASKRAYEEAKERRLKSVSERIRKSLIKTGLMTVGISKTGDSVIINDDILLSEKMKDALKGVTFTPGINKAIKILKDSYIPNIGGNSSIGSLLKSLPVINQAANIYNLATDATSSAIQIGKIVAAAYDKDITESTDNLLSGLQNIMDYKLITANDVANGLKEAIGSETEMLVLKDVVLETLKKGAIEGLSKQAIALEIGSRVLFGNKIMDFNISTASIQDYGRIVAGLILS